MFYYFFNYIPAYTGIKVEPQTYETFVNPFDQIASLGNYVKTHTYKIKDVKLGHVTF